MIIIARAKSKALFNIYSFLIENIKSRKKRQGAHFFVHFLAVVYFLFTCFEEEMFVSTLFFHCHSFSPW